MDELCLEKYININLNWKWKEYKNGQGQRNKWCKEIEKKNNRRDNMAGK
jgi:hypothetical protein